MNTDRIGARAPSVLRRILRPKRVFAVVITFFTVLSFGDPFPATFDLSSLDGSNGFAVSAGCDTRIVAVVSEAGDVNGDGVEDLLIGTRESCEPAVLWGAAHVVFGGSGLGSSVSVDLSTLDGTNGFRVDPPDLHEEGDPFWENFGSSVSEAGDVNGDGFDDLLVGAAGGDPSSSYSGAAFVIFGTDQPFPARLAAPSVHDRSRGVWIGLLANSFETVESVGGGGDVNGDGFDDFMIGAPSRGATPGFPPFPPDHHGTAYVVLGSTAIGGTFGYAEPAFVVRGIGEEDFLGRSVAVADDVNGDGFAELLLAGAGSVYVVFGSHGIGGSGTVDLTALDGGNGFVINNVVASALSEAGDVNGDGFGDLIIGASGASPNGAQSGASYVVFGGATLGTGGSLDLATLDGSNGFAIHGVAGFDRTGHSVGAAGDLNGDGFDDVIVGAPRSGEIFVGTVYVAFGGSAVGAGGTFELSAIDSTNGFVIEGLASGDRLGASVSGAGDLNDDGVDDIALGSIPSTAYVIFGEGGDTIPPSCTAKAAPNVLWPPNQRFVRVTTTVKVTDDDSGPAGFELVSIASSESNGGADVRDWNLGTADTDGWLRAKRSGGGTGRIYTLEYEAKDVAGNSASCSTTVLVPHDQGK